MTQLSLRNVIILAATAVLAFSSCKKKDGGTNAGGTEAYKDIEKTFDTTEPAPEAREPVKGIDMAGLEKPMAVRFESLVDQLPSPCGKAHSLRTSRNTDPSCKRASFAAKYVYALVKDGAPSAEAKQFYKLRFDATKPAVKFVLNAEMPHHGPTDAPVQLVEFYDYACPHCSRMRPLLQEALVGYETDVVVYYRQFPLSHNEDSPAAAQAAIAASKQGKFDEMHALLFENMSAHKASDLKGFAEKIGLDMAKFSVDMKAAAASVETDKAEGIKVGVASTPSLFINGRIYEGPMDPKYLQMWMDEELAQAI